MSDVHDQETRSRNMRAIRSGNTRPELVIRRALHKRGFRYRLHAKDLAGTPDILLPKYKAAIFVHGCFWHQHECSQFKMPSTRTDEWRLKIGKNVERDGRTLSALLSDGWRVAVVWECSVRGPRKPPFNSVIEQLTTWLKEPASPTHLVIQELEAPGT